MSLVTAFLSSSCVTGVLQSLPVSDSPASKTFENWKDIPLPVYNYLYLFNITNVNELLISRVVPDVKEVGESI